jgi:hypothetical protein
MNSLDVVRALVFEQEKYNDWQLEGLYEASLARIWQHTQNRNFGIITAHRGEHDAKENYRRNTTLIDDLRNRGFGFIPMRGHYIENEGTPEARHVTEDSFLVTSNTVSGSKRLGDVWE